MARSIEHTPYEWVVWRRRFVLLRRMSLRPWWGLLLYLSVGTTATVLIPVAMVLSQTGLKEGWSILPFGLAWVLVGSMLTWAFYRMFRADKGFSLPVRVWRIGAGHQLKIETYRDPQPTTMGGTQPGTPLRWLVVVRQNGRVSRLVQVHHEVDLFKANLVLTQPNPN